MPHRYTDGEIIYIKYIANGKSVYDIVEIFNNTFGTNLTYGQMKSCLTNHGIKTNVSRKDLNKYCKRKYTKEHLEYLKRHIKGTSIKDLTKMFNKNFKTDFTESAIKGYVSRNKLVNGRDGRIQKGNIPPQKGKKGIPMHPNAIATQFKKGCRPINYMPVGSERVNGDGYVDIKVADPNKWRGKHLVIWEQHNGAVPEGYAVIFGDRNRRNFNIDNLILITRKQLLIMNHNRLIQDDAELTKTGVAIADLIGKIKEIEKKLENNS